MSQHTYIPLLDESRPDEKPGDLLDGEKWWAIRQEALEQEGYMLRPRYRPDWRRSWLGANKPHDYFEDGQTMHWRLGMDAIRISDGKPVVMKRQLPEEGPYELEINRLFSTEPLASNPKNHCVQLLDVIKLPDDPPILVQPMLRPFDEPRFRTYGEFVTFFSQICEGVQFMHENNVAHRDCTPLNIMLDPSYMYPESFHPVKIDRSTKHFHRKAKRYSRTQRPTKYLLIDFGLSRRYDPVNGPPLDKPYRGGDHSAPEHQDRVTPCNPFPTDVYYLGNLVQVEYMQKYKGFKFMESLVADMVKIDPVKRLTMDEVVARFSEIRSKLSTWKLRSRMVRRSELCPVATWRSVGHWYRTVGYILGRKAAIPEPK